MAEVRPTTTYEALDEDRRIPFSAADEQAITGLTVWCKIVGIINIVIAAASATVSLLPMIKLGVFSLLVVLTVVIRDGAMLLLGLFLLQAAKPLRKMATTDVADKQYLVAGTMALTKYFNLTGVLMVLTVALLTVTIAGMLLSQLT
jgi:hypothetical protein